MDSTKTIKITEIAELRCFLNFLILKMQINQEKIIDYFVHVMDWSEDYALDILKFRKPKVLSEKFKDKLPKFVEHYLNEKSYHEYLKFRNGKSNLQNVDYKFVGRKRELELIRSHFIKNKNGFKALAKINVNPMVISKNISGPGGQGKTALAKEYAIQNSAYYSAVCWVDCRENIKRQIENFALFNNIPKIIAKTDELPIKYLIKLSNRFPKNILLIFDNVVTEKSDRASQIEHIIREAGSCNFHYLITSRQKLLTQKAETMNLNALKPEDAANLFLERSQISNITSDNQQLVELTSKSLGGHALSIALIAAYSKEHNVTDLTELIEIIDNFGVTHPNVASGITLEEYPISLYAALEISFESIGKLGKENQLLFLLLTLFPRYSIPINFVNDCMKSFNHLDKSPLKELKIKFSITRGEPRPFKILFRHNLLEKDHSNFSMHEVIYDYALHKWTLLIDSNDIHLKLAETSFIRSSCECASLKFHLDTAKYDEVKSIAGLLTPEIKKERNYIPSLERIKLSLDFWFNHYKFHQFVYDTELQEALLPSLEKLRDYLIQTDELEVTHDILLSKLIGHAYYGSPKTTGEKAQKLFLRAYTLAKNEQQSTPNSVLSWYIVFLMDHMINITSKNRTQQKSITPVHLDNDFTTDIQAIISELPEALITLQEPPKDLTLLLRSAHFWGHRGNQDSYTLYQQLILDKYDDNTLSLIELAKSHYYKAISCRLIALKSFKSNKYIKKLEKSSQSWSFLKEGWLKDLKVSREEMDIEWFTSLYQGIGDTAHQCRGLNFVLLLEVIYKIKTNGLNVQTNELQETYMAAEELWNIASSAIDKNEVPIKYVIWMCSSKVLLELVINLIEKREILPLSYIEKQMNANLEKAQKSLSAGYSFGADEQKAQVKEVWKLLNNISL